MSCAGRGCERVAGMHLFLRAATPEDATVLAHWDTQPHVREAIGSSGFYSDWATEIADAPSWREILIAQIEDRPLGLLHIIDPAREPARYWGDVEPNLRALDIWIGEAQDLNCGYGTMMMQLAHLHCFANPEVKAIIIDPLSTNTDAQRFYRRLGYQFIETRRFRDSECAVYRLQRSAYATTSAKASTG